MKSKVGMTYQNLFNPNYKLGVTNQCARGHYSLMQWINYLSQHNRTPKNVSTAI